MKTVSNIENLEPADEREHPRVVIVGAGFGGMSAALEFARLKKKFRKDQEFEVVLIDKNDFQLFTPDLYEIASASREIENEQDLKDAVCLDVRVALGQQSIGFIKGDVERIDTNAQVVHTHKGEVHYDYLVVALGSNAHYYGIKGMEENSIALKNINDAVAIRSEVHRLLAEKDDVHVIICGAGPAGVEVGAEMRVACKSLNEKKCPAITIVEGKSSVLPPFPQRVQRKVAKRLKSLGVHVKTDFFIENAEKGRLTSKEGDVLEGDLIVWTGGVKSSALLDDCSMTLSPHGQIPVNRTMQSKEKKNVFVVGDCAEVEVSAGSYCPQTAHEAVLQGPIAARNICNLLLGKKMKDHQLKEVGYVITLGGKKGIISFDNGFVLTGRIGWVVRKWIDFRHFRSVLPFMHACSVWYKGVKVMTKND